ncbi:hypothetical protein Tco_0490485 [Tanacetum coccineum]
MLVDGLLHHEGGQTGRGGGRTGDQGGRGGGRGNGANGGIDEVPDFSIFIARQIARLTSYYRRSSRNVNMNNRQSGCSYKDFVACKPKEFYSKEDFKALMKEEYCPSNEMQKLETEFWSRAMVGTGHAAYID